GVAGRGPHLGRRGRRGGDGDPVGDAGRAPSGGVVAVHGDVVRLAVGQPRDGGAPARGAGGDVPAGVPAGVPDEDAVAVDRRPRGRGGPGGRERRVGARGRHGRGRR